MKKSIDYCIITADVNGNIKHRYVSKPEFMMQVIKNRFMIMRSNLKKKLAR